MSALLVIFFYKSITTNWKYFQWTVLNKRLNSGFRFLACEYFFFFFPREPYFVDHEISRVLDCMAKIDYWKGYLFRVYDVRGARRKTSWAAVTELFRFWISYIHFEITYRSVPLSYPYRHSGRRLISVDRTTSKVTISIPRTADFKSQKSGHGIRSGSTGIILYLVLVHEIISPGSYIRLNLCVCRQML